ncbi:hypothetical protein [Robertmurraya sp. P23]|uniref:hypothetical protein n=1 Tax=Robertmurraya sp. P23 TaxID=3436931 RepID=UPI003D996805
MKSVLVIELASLSKKLLDSTMLFFREDGIQIREAILSEASSTSAHIIVLDFRDIKVIDFSCSDEIVVMLQENNEWLNGKKIYLKNLTTSHKENIHSALEMKKLGVWIKEEHGYHVIGKLPKHLLQLVRTVMNYKECTARHISNDTGEELTSISVKLGKLYKKGMLLRKESKTSEGMEYVYQSIV